MKGMRHTPKTSGNGAADPSDRTVWQRARAADAVFDEAERFLDLAGFADGRLDADDRERVAVLVAGDPDAAADVTAALELAGTQPMPAAARIVARAEALTGAPERGRVIPFIRAARPEIVSVARWGSLAAAIAFAGWIGFALGSDASLAFGQIAQAHDDGAFADLFDPAGGILRNITNGPES
jgi:anti-sigma factor RsiW